VPLDQYDGIFGVMSFASLGFCRFAVQEHFPCMDLGLIDFVDLSSSVLVMLKTL
jgi:hypothetical protein